MNLYHMNAVLWEIIGYNKDLMLIDNKESNIRIIK